MTIRSWTPFEQWAALEDIPVIRGYAVEDLNQIPLKSWHRKGGKGALIILEGGEGFSSGYVCEIPPGTSLKPQRHIFEERIYILKGKGETRVWNEGGKAQTFAWHEYSLFSPPLNTWHQHTNTGDQPAKYVAVTNTPLVFDIYRNSEFIFNINFAFKDRYNSESDYFDGAGKMGTFRNVQKASWKGGLIPDVHNLNPPTTVEFGKGFGLMELDISGNSMLAHLARVEVGTYKKPHRHAGGAHLIITQGTGFALMWKEWNDRVMANFKEGSIYSPPEGWWHTHANTGTEEVRQIALRRGFTGVGKIYQERLGIKEGGDMMEREDEPPELRRLFEAELAKKGLKSHMTPLR